MAEKKKEVRRGRYNMDFDLKKGNPHENFQKACHHIDELKKKELLMANACKRET